MTRYLYLVLCFLGAALPYSQLVPFLREHGFDLRVLGEQLFANRISAFFGLDVVVSSVVLWAFVFVEGRRRKIKNLWLPVVGSLVVGVSLGLPLFLYMRERYEERQMSSDSPKHKRTGPRYHVSS